MLSSIAEAQKRDKERDRQRQQEEERRIFELEQNEKRKKYKMNEVNVTELAEDDKALKHAGDAEIENQKLRGGIFDDTDFSKQKAIGELNKEYAYIRSKDIQSHDGSTRNQVTKVFADGATACDIRQGSLGDCYLLSAMSVVAHTRPELITKIFHPDSRQFREDGLYTIMLYSAKSPVFITVDD